MVLLQYTLTANFASSGATNSLFSYLCHKDTKNFNMADYPTLNFPAIRLRARRTPSGRTEIFDAVRGRWLVLTPEEWVRRHVVEYLIAECGYSPQQLIEEYCVELNGMTQRADIVAIGCDAQPRLIVECKEPGVKLGRDVLAQVVRYNSVVGCRYMVITNGLETHCWELTAEGYTPRNSLPHCND